MASDRGLRLQSNAVDAGGWAAGLVYNDGGIQAIGHGDDQRAALMDLILTVRLAEGELT